MVNEFYFQNAVHHLDMSVYTADGFATAGHRLVFLTNFEILQKFPDTDSVILPDFSSAAVRALFTVMYDTSHRYKYICKLISTFSLKYTDKDQ